MKRLVTIILFLLVLIPFSVDAASISGVSISTPVEQEKGNQFYVPVHVSFSGVDKNYGDSGIFEVVLVVDYDDSVLDIVDIHSDFFSSTLTKVRNGEGLSLGLPDGNYIISITDPNATGNKCSDQFLACFDYDINIKFYVKDDSVPSTDIKVDAGAIAFKIDNTLESYTEENMQELESSSIATTTVNIKKTDKVVTTEPEKNITVNNNIQSTNDILNSAKENANNQTNNNSSSNNNNNNNNSNNNPEVKSNNKYLSSLQVENYNLSFDKNIYEYNLDIEPGVNALNITATVEDPKSTYQIIGSDDLKQNNNQVVIKVTAENGEESSYIITTKVKEENDIALSGEKKKKDKKSLKFNIKLKKEHFIIGGVALLILFIVFIIIKLKDRKIDKALKNL